MARWTTAFLAATLLGAPLLGAPAVLPDRDRPGELEGVVSFHCHTEPYLFLEDDKDQSWRVEFSSQDAISHIVAGDRVKVRGIFPKRATTPRMRDATVEVVGKGAVPPYIEMTPAEMHAIGPDGEPGKRFWYGKLVSEGRAYALTVGYRSSSAAEIAFSCDGSLAITVKLPANATRGIVQSPRPLAVPAGASVIRWALVSGGPDFQLVGLQLK